MKALDPDWIRIGIQLKMLDQDPESNKPDPDPTLFAVLASVQAPELSQDVESLMWTVYFFHSYLRLSKTISSVFFYPYRYR
jgi:hypothetical protein